MDLVDSLKERVERDVTLPALNPFLVPMNLDGDHWELLVLDLRHER